MLLSELDGLFEEAMMSQVLETKFGVKKFGKKIKNFLKIKVREVSPPNLEKKLKSPVITRGVVFTSTVPIGPNSVEIKMITMDNLCLVIQDNQRFL